MPAPDITPGAPCWIDLMTSDITKARQFYGELFGWDFEAGDQEKYGGYTTARKNGKTVAGIMQKPEDSPFGRLATLADPTGAVFKIVADN